MLNSSIFSRNFDKIGYILKNIATSRAKGSFFIALTIILCFVMYYAKEIAHIWELPNPLSYACLTSLITLIAFAIYAAILYILGTPCGQRKHEEAFKAIGLINKIGVPPLLIAKSREQDFKICEYLSVGIPLNKVQDLKDSIEAALNISIISIYMGKDYSKFRIKYLNGDHQIPDYIEWNDKYMPDDIKQFAIGADLLGIRKIDLDDTPHVQCGGMTGSGKTILLKSVLHQAFLKGYRVILCDFKNFVDFSGEYMEKSECIETKEELLEALKMLVEEMNARKRLLRESGCANMSTYNRLNPSSPHKPILLACDEISHAFNKKGADKATRGVIEGIESYMSLIAQQGRGMDIHLWLSTQRGDYETIPGQIKSNLTLKICGRADDVLSRVTIDSTLASDISPEHKGRFFDDQGNEFQGFDI